MLHIQNEELKTNSLCHEFGLSGHARTESELRIAKKSDSRRNQDI